MCCDPSLEPSRRDGSNDGSQNMFLWENMDYYPKIIPVTPSYLEHGFSLEEISLELCRIFFLYITHHDFIFFLKE